MRIMPCLLLALAPLDVGCNSGYSSGVDGSKPASTLTASEAAIACENLGEYVRSSFPQSEVDSVNCYIQSLTSETDPEACEAAYRACLTDPPEGPFEFGTIDCTGAEADATCNANVSDVEACVTATVNASRDRLAAVDCSIAGTITELQRLQDPLPAPTECSSLGATCPNLADGAF